MSRSRWVATYLVIAPLTVGVLFSAYLRGAAPVQAQGNNPVSPLLGGGPLSERVVAYEIDAHLDAEQRSIEATEVLTYRNLTGRPLQEFPFHLYLNAFQPGSTFMRELRRDNRTFKWKEKYYGSIEVKSLEAAGMGDLTDQMEFVQPDDGNPDDRTVFRVRLPRPVPPGRSVQFRMAFTVQLPEVLARTGYKRNFFYVAQWFPKVGVWWKGEWNCHQFHRSTEFFADFGTYDVKVTVPQDYIVGATGVEVASTANPNGTKTLAFRAEDVHDFAWSANPNFHVVEDSWSGSEGTVKIRLLMSPGHLRQADRYLQTLKGTMELFDRWYGPYPYSQITVVDPPHGGLGAGGMEYPMLITAGTTWWMPAGLRLPEVVTEHEFGHQYWYGIVASNEFEDAWLDEGINQYVEAKIMASLYGEERSMIDLWGLTAGDASVSRVQYAQRPDTDPLVRTAYEFMTGGAYGTVTYAKTATVLLTLEGLIGEETLRRAIRTYFMRYRFTHPTEEDFLKTVEEVAGQDLRWFFDQAVYGTQVLDYAVRTARSDRVDWHVEEPPEEKKGETLYNTQVVVHRKGDFILPVEVEIKFDNGEVLREQWDGRDRWVRFTYQKPTKIAAVEIDPDHKVWLDANRFNNSRTAEKDTHARRKLSAYWFILTQFFAQALAWLT